MVAQNALFPSEGISVVSKKIRVVTAVQVISGQITLFHSTRAHRVLIYFLMEVPWAIGKFLVIKVINLSFRLLQ